MKKEILLTPGPTVVPDRVLDAMRVSQLHHRTDVFKKELNKALEGLAWLTECPTCPIILSCSGSGGLEAVIANTCAPGDKVVAINAGAFGERWVKIAQRFGAQVVEIKAPDGFSPDLSVVEETLRKNADAKLFLVAYSETSTTVLHPVPVLAGMARKLAPHALVCVDAISALATLPISFKELEVDVVVGASQKALGLPPGLAFLMLSQKAWDRVEQSERRSFYFDLVTERKNQTQGTTAWTPATTIVLGLNESLSMLREETLPKVYARHHRLARMTRAALQALNCTLLTKTHHAFGVTGAIPPASVNADELRKSLLSLHGIRIAGGQASFKGISFRVGHMGYVNEHDILNFAASLEMTLEEFGASQTRGTAVAAALREFN